MLWEVQELSVAQEDAALPAAPQRQKRAWRKRRAGAGRTFHRRKTRRRTLGPRHQFADRGRTAGIFST
jgi:hypothetical protein